ncbi:MAG: hypothetical protein R2856_35200 [Caldilineaceae bacterium]
MRSRGMSKSTLFGLTMLEQLLLFVVAAPLGILAGMGLKRLMGNTASFLTFARARRCPFRCKDWTCDWWCWACLLRWRRLVPVLNMSRTTVVQQERAHARQTQRPFWQRIYLDFILVIPAIYVYRQLLLRGSFVDPNVGGPEGYSGSIARPRAALFVVTAALLVMRFFPLLMTVLDWLAGRMPWLTPHLVLRQLGRHSAAYSTPLLLVIVLLAMGIYTVSMASSLDRWLVDRIYYSVEADMRFLPFLPSETNPVPVVTQRGVQRSARCGRDGAGGRLRCARGHRPRPLQRPLPGRGSARSAQRALVPQRLRPRFAGWADEPASRRSGQCAGAAALPRRQCP